MLWCAWRRSWGSGGPGSTHAVRVRIKCALCRLCGGSRGIGATTHASRGPSGVRYRVCRKGDAPGRGSAARAAASRGAGQESYPAFLSVSTQPHMSDPSGCPRGQGRSAAGARGEQLRAHGASAACFRRHRSRAATPPSPSASSSVVAGSGTEVGLGPFGPWLLLFWPWLFCPNAGSTGAVSRQRHNRLGADRENTDVVQEVKG